jgi:putative nucleotidyltransferase with HDIG domain
MREMYIVLVAILDTGYWILDAGCWMLDAGCWIWLSGSFALPASSDQGLESEDRAMTREEALELVESKVKNKNLVKHMIATEACMRSLARHFQEDEDLWGLTGLLHDLDYDQTAKDFPRHGLLGAQMLEEIGADERIVYAVKAHPGHVEAKSMMDKALFAVDPLTGLIVAAALMHPTKKLNDVDTRFVLNRFKEKRFAAGADRDTIRTCENLGLSLEEFITISLEAMKGVADELGL